MTAPSLSPLLDQLDEALRNRGTSLYADEVYAATVPAALPQLTAAVRGVLALADELDRDARTDRDTVLWVTDALRSALTAALTPGADTAGATA